MVFSIGISILNLDLMAALLDMTCCLIEASMSSDTCLGVTFRLMLSTGVDFSKNIILINATIV